MENKNCKKCGANIEKWPKKFANSSFPTFEVFQDGRINVVGENVCFYPGHALDSLVRAVEFSNKQRWKQ